MDYVRSFYSTKAHFKAGDARQSTIRWYAAPPGAKPFPHRHSFGSLNWSNGSKAGNTVGEVIGAARPYTNLAGPTCSDGSHFVGTESDFLNGISDFLVSKRAENACGQPVACTKFAYDGKIGAAGGILYDLPGQPWYDGGFPATTVWTTGYTTNFQEYNYSPNQTYEWHDYTLPFPTQVLVTHLRQSDFQGIAQVVVNLGAFVPISNYVKLIAYDSLTFTGTYVIEPPNPSIPNFRFYLHMPPVGYSSFGAMAGIVSSQNRLPGLVAAMASSAGVNRSPLLVKGTIGASAATTAGRIVDRLPGTVGAFAGVASVVQGIDMPYSGAKALGSVNVAQNVQTAVPFTIKDWDTDNYVTLNASQGLFTVPNRTVDTYYRITIYVTWAVPPTVVCGRMVQVIQGQGWTPPSGQLNFNFQLIDYQHANWGHGIQNVGSMTFFVPANMTPNYKFSLYCDGGGPFAADCTMLIERIGA